MPRKTRKAPAKAKRKTATREPEEQRGLYILTKMSQRPEPKRQIAKHIAETYVADFDAVLLDAGSTAELIAEELFLQRRFLSVMTNNLGAYAAYTRVIRALAPQGGAVAVTPDIGLLNENELLLAGGRYDATYEACFGDTSLRAIETFTPNVTIIGVSGLRFKEGVMCHGAEDVRVKHLLWTKPTDVRLIAADWTKMGRRDAHAFGLSVADLGNGARRAVVVTSRPPRDAPSDDRRLFDEQVHQMEKAGIDVDQL